MIQWIYEVNELVELLTSKAGPLFFQVFKGEFQLPDFLKEQSQVQ